MPRTPDSPAPSRRRWFRISIRGLMILVLMSGGGIGWQIQRVRTQRLALEVILAEPGHQVLYDYQFATDPAVMARIRSVQEPTAPAVLRRWLGDDWFRTPVSVGFRQNPSGIPPKVIEALGHLDGLVQIRLSDSTGSNGDWSPLGRLRRLEVVTLIGVGVSDQAVAAISASPSLQSVRLIGTRVTNAGLAPLARLANLRVLEVDHCPHVNDAGLARVLATSRSRSLARLSWNTFNGSAQATVRALAEHHPNLARLTLTHGAVEDADLASIAALTGLTDLNLTWTQISDAGLVHLEPLAKLAHLEVNRAVLTDRGLQSVGPLRNLTELGPRLTLVTDAGLAELAELTRLEQLTLDAPNVTDAGIATLARLPALRRLTVLRGKLTDEALNALQAAPRLRELDLIETAITPAAIARFKATRPGVAVTVQATWRMLSESRILPP